MKKCMFFLAAVTLISIGLIYCFGQGTVDNPFDSSGYSTTAQMDAADTAVSNGVTAAFGAADTADRVYSVDAGNHTNRPFHETVAFLSTNATYETTWFGPWPSALTLSSAFSKCDFGTQGVYLVEQATNAVWRAYASTNIFVVATTTGTNGTAFDDATVDVGNLLGVKLWTGTSTQGFITVQGRW